MRRRDAGCFDGVCSEYCFVDRTSRLRRAMHLTLPAMQVAILHRTAHLLHGRGLEPIRFGPGGQPFEPLHGKKPEQE